MVEIIFVIVILGILAAVAIPYLVATRDDATLVVIKKDITTVLTAVPAWYTGQNDVRIIKAVELDTSKWNRFVASEEAYTWYDGGNACVTIAIYDQNETISTVADTTDINMTTGSWLGTYEPVLRIIDAGSSSFTCRSLWSNIEEINITIAGKSLQ